MFGSLLPPGEEETEMPSSGYPVEAAAEADTGSSVALPAPTGGVSGVGADDRHGFGRSHGCRRCSASAAPATPPKRAAPTRPARTCTTSSATPSATATASRPCTDLLKAIGGNWDYIKLEDYVENPKHLAPKGSMSFIGLKKPEDRAAVIKYLMSQTDNPPPLPAADQAPAAPAAPLTMRARKPLCAIGTMSRADACIDLADLSGEIAACKLFPHRHCRRRQGRRQPRHLRRPGRPKRSWRAFIQRRDIPEPRHHRRGTRPRAHRGRMAVDPRPHRRHGLVHQRRAAVRHVDRAVAPRTASGGAAALPGVHQPSRP